jgi:hypothetical protein
VKPSDAGQVKRELFDSIGELIAEHIKRDI